MTERTPFYETNVTDGAENAYLLTGGYAATVRGDTVTLWDQHCRTIQLSTRQCIELGHIMTQRVITAMARREDGRGGLSQAAAGAAAAGADDADASLCRVWSIAPTVDDGDGGAAGLFGGPDAPGVPGRGGADDPPTDRGAGTA